MEKNILAQTFTPRKIFAYGLPTVCMMVFMSAYMIVDGMFVAKYLGELAFSALNIVYPVISAVLALALMLSIGSSAVIGTLMGEGKVRESREFFTQMYVIGIAVSTLCLLLTSLFPQQILALLQTSPLVFPFAEEYLVYTGYFFVFSLLQVYSQTFLVTAGKPFLGFVICFLGGCSNIFLDYLFIARLDWGIKGAAIATGIGFGIPGLFGLLYFFCNKKSSLHFVKFRWDFPKLWQSLLNGSSEGVTNLAVAIITLLFNVILQNMAGEAGVSSYTAILYIQMFQMGIYMGFSQGVSPIISFKHGAGDLPQLRLVLRFSLQFLTICSLAVVGLSVLFAEEAVGIFIPPDSETFPMATKGLLLYSLAYLFMGYNVFLSSFFTALSQGKVSAILSFTRNFFCIVLSVLTLPQVLDLEGVWLSVPVAEVLALCLGLYYFFKLGNVFQEGWSLPLPSFESVPSGGESL